MKKNISKKNICTHFLILVLIGICFIGCGNAETKGKTSKKDCKGTKYYKAGYKMGQYSRNIQPDKNYQTYGVEYYRLQDGILKEDPQTDCYDEGFSDGKMGR